MGTLPIHDDTGATRRKHERANTFVAASLVHGDGTANVRIRNISASGALVSGLDLPARGEPCTLLRGTRRVNATVIRVDEDEAGLAFSRQIDVYGWLAAAHLRSINPGDAPAAHRQSGRSVDPHELACRVDFLFSGLSREACLTPKQLLELRVLEDVARYLRSAR